MAGKIFSQSKHISLIASLGKVFSFLYILDLDKRTLQKVFTENTPNHRFIHVEEITDSNDMLLDRYVDEDYSQEILSFFDVATIPNRLSHNPVVSQAYKATNGEWMRCGIVPYEYDSNGALSSVIITVRIVTHEMNSIQTKDNVIQALGSDCFSVLLVDLDLDNVSVFRANDTDGAFIAEQSKLQNNCWSKLIANYNESIVSSESRSEFSEKLSIDYMKSQTSDYAFVYAAMRGKRGIVYYQARISYVHEKNDKTVVVVSTRNVDAMVKKERENERLLQEVKIAKSETENKAKTDFLFNMSHDIRTPMNAIMGFTDLLRKNIDNRDKILDYLDKIESSNKFLLSLINNVLDMARIESGKETLDETSVNIRELHVSLSDLFSSQMRNKGVNFLQTVEIEHENIFADPTKLRQILVNVISNALKYTPSGGTVTMSLTELPSGMPDCGIYKAEITDTGIGMSKEFLPKLFNEFTREHNSTISKIEGTGLGMPIVKRLVELMKGSIEVESKLGEGTRFTITIPFRVSADAPSSKECKPEAISQKLAGKRILLAEDNDLNAEIAMTILEEEGFKVERAEDGIVCVNMLHKSAPGYYDLILMDIQMPNMDGYKASLAIRRSEDPVKSHIPIVAMTANAFEEDRRTAFLSGMNEHLAKPIDIDKLNGTLLKLLLPKG